MQRSTVGRNKKAIKAYIQNRLEEDKVSDQSSITIYMAKEKVTVFGGLFCCGSDRCMMKLVAPEHKAKLFGTKGGK